LWDLRWPGVVYTLMTAAMVGLLGWKLSGQLETGLVALLTYLAFFSTYRYGRPFLTDAPSVFWLFVPWFALLMWRRTLDESRLMALPVLGLFVGIGLLYRSFALLLPVGVCLTWWCLRERRYRIGVFLTRDAAPLLLLAVVALGVFGVWFAFDPDPGAVMREFVLRENAGKFDAPDGYLLNFLWGASSIWRLVIAYPLNAGLLLFPVIALFVVGYKRRAELGDDEVLLWMWVVALFVVFALPSQRDERYLLPGMPAVAVLCAINRDRLGVHAFRASLGVTFVAVSVLAYLAFRLDAGVPGDRLYSVGYWLLMTLAAASALGAFLRPQLAPVGLSIAVLLTFLGFAALVRPLDNGLGKYSQNVQDMVGNQTVWVPANFVAREEGHRFLLPGADVRGYPSNPGVTVTDLAARYPLFAITVPMTTSTVTGGAIVGQRLDIGTRHTPQQIREMLRGNVFEHLFVKELLVESSTASPAR
ncbi:MAG: ArnT family glycosyltransferase, partial [Vicinamibacterales bacterium]